jgi:hypothetical protein
VTAKLKPTFQPCNKLRRLDFLQRYVFYLHHKRRYTKLRKS